MTVFSRNPFLLPIVLGAVAAVLLVIGAQNVAALDAPQSGLGLKHPLIVGAAIALGAFHLGLSALLRRDTPTFHLGMLAVYAVGVFLVFPGLHPRVGGTALGGMVFLCASLAWDARRRGAS